MPWSSPPVVSDALSLSGAYQTVQAGASDMVVSLEPGETALIMLDFNPQVAPTEDLDVRIQKSHDGTTFASDGQGWRVWIESVNQESDDPAIEPVVVRDCESFRIRARLRTPADDPGGSDTGSTLTVRYATDQISL